MAAPTLTVATLQLGDIMTTEDMTNAVWNRILHDLFPAPRYLISPEYSFTTRGGKSGRADLAVLFAGTRKVLVVYEGKKSGGGINTLVDALGQATTCLSAKSATMGVAIAALGDQFSMTDKDLNDVGKFEKDKGGQLWIQENLDEIADYLAKTAAAGRRP
ncbi:hypothetical protein B0T10DRAFT_581619 [Thelonectria olida]|uniref:Uncharacterized protein n=1 Tax=Thelonectria olida TaxID=1576542 RepID=A0A9P9AK51_9HYPO|nr:hypothetical protein B0T10DRAFT_581619 [Thelonectria olida]